MKRNITIVYGDSLWALVMSIGKGYTAQEWKTRNYFPKDEIDELWKKGYFITQFSRSRDR